MRVQVTAFDNSAGRNLIAIPDAYALTEDGKKEQRSTAEMRRKNIPSPLSVDMLYDLAMVERDKAKTHVLELIRTGWEDARGLAQAIKFI